MMGEVIIHLRVRNTFPQSKKDPSQNKHTPLALWKSVTGHLYFYWKPGQDARGWCCFGLQKLTGDLRSAQKN